jgi:transcription antitermination factor NusB
MAREMAVQMLYQSDLGGSSLPQVFSSFDVTEYMARDDDPAKKAARETAAVSPAPAPAVAAVPVSIAPPLLTGEARTEWNRQRKRVDEAFQYAQALVRGTLDSLDKIDELIRSQADNWRLERMPAVDRNILRLAVYEMLHETETPKLVVVDEAIELAKKFGSEQSGRFVNGLLDGLLKQHTFPGTLK